MKAAQLPWREVHFTGIGGVGMTGLALILLDLGVAVSGSDQESSANTELLTERGARIVRGHAASHLGKPELLVYSSAVPESNPERRRARELGLPERRRGLFLADLAPVFPRVVSVAGSHGKTTVTAMLAAALKGAGQDPGYLVGGKVPGWPAPAGAGDGSVLVTEVDESDGTQAAMRSTHAIVVNVEDDHCWSVGGEEALMDCFRTFAGRSEFLLAGDSPRTRELFAGHPRAEFLPAGAGAELQLALPGAHNRFDAALALRMAELLGADPERARRALATFGGVDRRLSLRYQDHDVLLFEDYAHHPTEVRASLAGLRERYPRRRLRVIFQPHRYERIARYAADFARELAQADEVVVTAPFAAWVDDGNLADPASISSKIGERARYAPEELPELAGALVDGTRADDLLVVMGAGTITRLVPLLTDRFAARKEPVS